MPPGSRLLTRSFCLLSSVIRFAASASSGICYFAMRFAPRRPRNGEAVFQHSEARDLAAGDGQHEGEGRLHGLARTLHSRCEFTDDRRPTVITAWNFWEWRTGARPRDRAETDRITHRWNRDELIRVQILARKGRYRITFSVSASNKETFSRSS